MAESYRWLYFMQKLLLFLTVSFKKYNNDKLAQICPHWWYLRNVVISIGLTCSYFPQENITDIGKYTWCPSESVHSKYTLPQDKYNCVLDTLNIGWKLQLGAINYSNPAFPAHHLSWTRLISWTWWIWPGMAMEKGGTLATRATFLINQKYLCTLGK